MLFNKNVHKLLANVGKKENIQNIVLILAAFISGLTAVLYARLFKICEPILAQITNEKKELVFLVTPLAFLLAWLLVYYFSPEASGSGIPQVLFANELEEHSATHSKARDFLSLKVLVVKVASSLICVIGGGAIGREGPTIQISASIFYFFGRRLRRILPEIRSHLWIISGAGAGLAAAFNTPLGGIIYAIEELGAAHFHRVRTILLGAIITAGLVSLWLSGNYLYLGFPNIPDEGLAIFPLAILVGGISGLLGSLFSSVLFTLSKARRLIKSKIKLAGITLACGLLMAALIYFDDNSSGSGVGLLNEFLFHDKGSSASLILVRFFGTIISYLSGAAGGIFSPSLAIGGAVGGYLANLLHSHDQNILVLFGMIGFLAGVTRTPITSFILVMEMTNRHSAILPMMLASMVAVLTASLISRHSFYERVKILYEEEFGLKPAASSP